MNTKVVGRRVVALIIDVVLIAAINLAIFFAFAGDPVEGLADGSLSADSTVYGNLEIGDKTYSVYGGTAGLYFLLATAIPILYFVVFQGMRGFTLGKAMLGLRLVKDDGSTPPGVGRAFGRWFLFIADGFPYFIPYLTGFIVAMVNKRNKRIGDIVAGTLVVDKHSLGAAPGASGLSSDPAPTWAEGPQSGSGL